MKFVQILSLLLMLTVSSGLNAQKATSKKSNSTYMQSNSKVAQNSHPGVHLTFANEETNLGKVKKGDTKKFDLEFTNTGSETITIDIASSCDCTTLDYPKTPIKAGEKATIHVIFDSSKKEESEVIDVDLYLKNINPKTGQRILRVVKYKYELIK